MRYLLSIKTVIPKPGGRVWHDDQLEAHGQIYDGDDGIDYAFMGSDPNAAVHSLHDHSFHPPPGIEPVA